MAFPTGVYNADTLTALAATGMRIGMSNEGSTFYTLPIAQPLYMAGGALGPAYTLAQVQTAFLAGKARGDICTMGWDGLVESGAGAGEWNRSDFVGLLDWIRTQQIVPVTIDDLYRLQSGAVTVPRPW